MTFDADVATYTTTTYHHRTLRSFLDAVTWHREQKSPCRAFDNPMQLVIGFETPKPDEMERHVVSLKTIKVGFADNSLTGTTWDVEVLKRTLATPEGRDAFFAPN